MFDNGAAFISTSIKLNSTQLNFLTEIQSDTQSTNRAFTCNC